MVNMVADATLQAATRKKKKQQKKLLWAPAEYQQRLNNYVHFISQ